jgi:hypothetical protein
VKKRLHVARRRLRASLERLTLGELTERVFDEYRPSRNPEVKKRIMTSTDFLEKIAFGDVSAVTAALDAQPTLLHVTGPARMWTGSVDPLTMATASGRPAIVRVLIARGASVATRPGRPSLVVSAAIEGHREVVDVHPVSVGFTPLHEASVRGEDAIVKLLIEYGADVNARGGSSLSRGRQGTWTPFAS